MVLLTNDEANCCHLQPRLSEIPEDFDASQPIPAGINPAVLQAYEPLDDDIIECQTRVHPLAAKELEMVEDAHPCTKGPLFLPADYNYPKSLRSELSFMNAGIAKVYRGADSVETVEGAATYHAYGEDMTVKAPIVENTEEKWAWLLAVFDGHGLAAQEAVTMASRVLVEKSLAEAPELLKALDDRDGEKIRRLEYRKFMAMEESVITQEHIGGGTTCSTVELVRLDKRHFMVVSNVGDSPVVMVNNKDGKVSMLSGQHAWDNKEERAKYINRCNQKGLVPREVCYGRINAGGMVMEDLEGRVRGGKPLHMYHPGTADLDVKTRDHLCNLVQRRYRVSIGGSQSIRRFTIQQRRRRKSIQPDKIESSQRPPWFLFGTGGGGTTPSPQSAINAAAAAVGPIEWSAWENVGVIPEYGHLNWGPTVLVNGEGKIQVSRSLGDREEKAISYIWAEPDVAIHEFTPEDVDVTIIVCSDGAADLWWFHQMGEIARKYFYPAGQGEEEASSSNSSSSSGNRSSRTAEGLTKQLYDLTMSKGQRTSGYGEMKGRPVWDDISIVVARLVLKGGDVVVAEAGASESRPPEPAASVTEVTKVGSGEAAVL